MALKRAGISFHFIFKAFSILKFPSKPLVIVSINFFLRLLSEIGFFSLFCMKKVSKAYPSDLVIILALTISYPDDATKPDICENKP